MIRSSVCSAVLSACPQKIAEIEVLSGISCRVLVCGGYSCLRSNWSRRWNHDGFSPEVTVPSSGNLLAKFEVPKLALDQYQHEGAFELWITNWITGAAETDSKSPDDMMRDNEAWRGAVPIKLVRV